MPERFECTTLAKEALYKYSSFPFLFSEHAVNINEMNDAYMAADK